MTEHRRAGAGRHELAVAGDRHLRRREIVAAPVRDRFATEPPTGDRVVGRDAQRTDRPRLEPVVDDLDARYQRIDVLCDRGVRMATVDWFDINADAEGELGLDDASVNWSAASVAPLGEVLSSTTTGPWAGCCTAWAKRQ